MSLARDIADLGAVTSRLDTVGASSGALSNRNILINSAMNVAQRATSASGVGATSGYFVCDRWAIGASTSGRFSMAQNTDSPNGFNNSLSLACTTADTSIASTESVVLRQIIEGQNLQQFAKGSSDAKEFAVSFYVKGNASATYTCELFDADNSRQISKTFSVTTAWTRVTLTFPADTTGAFADDNGISLYFNIWLHAGSNFTSGTLNSTSWAANTNANRVSSSQTSFLDSTSRVFYITGIQLEVGSVTDFEHEPYSVTLSKAQRYLEVRGTDTSGWEFLADAGQLTSATTYQLAVRFNEQMRAAPTFSYTGNLSDIYLIRASNIFASTSVGAADNTNGRTILLTGNVSNTSGSAGEQTRMQTQVAGTKFFFDAEL